MSGGFPMLPQLCNGSDIGSDLTNFGTSMTTGAIGVWGSWAALTASSPIDACWIDLSLFPTRSSANLCAFQLGVGPAGSEIVIADGMVSCSNTSESDLSLFSFPISIPAGSRIAVRASASFAAQPCFANARLYDGSFEIEGCAGVDALGFVLANTTGTTMTGSLTAGAKGSYSQIIAATARDYVGFVVGLTNGSSTNWAYIDIAIGAAGQEQALVPNLGVRPSNASSRATIAGPFFIPIPAGSRVAVRMDDFGGGSNQDVVIYGIYK